MFQILFKKQIWESQIGFCFYSRTKPWWISKHCFTPFPIRNRVPLNHGKGQIVLFEPGQGWFLWKPFSRVYAMSCVWCVPVGKMGVRSSFSHSVVVKVAGLTQLLCTQDQFCTYSQNQIWVACVSNEVAVCLDLLSWSQQCLISEESKLLPRCNSKFLSWWVAHESLFFSQAADVLAWKPFPRFMEAAEFGYFEYPKWVRSFLLLNHHLEFQICSWCWWICLTAEQAEDDDQKGCEGALPEENLKYSLVSSPVSRLGVAFPGEGKLFASLALISLV